MKIGTVCCCIFAGTWLATATPELWFHSGFEGDTRIVRKTKNFDLLVGADQTFAPPNDWGKLLVEHPEIGSVKLFYGGGTPAQRSTQIVPDPSDPSNKVLEFRLSSANETPLLGAHKGRIQLSMDHCQLKEFSYQTRLRLEEGFATLGEYPGKISWLTLAEFWNDEAKSAFPFRITLNLNKEAGIGKPLFWGVHGQIRKSKGKWEDCWRFQTPDALVPIGEWATLAVCLVDAEGDHGKIVITIQREGREPKTILEYCGWMHHPEEEVLDGFRSVNPLKLYTSKDLLSFLRRREHQLVVLWDDFQFTGKLACFAGH